MRRGGRRGGGREGEREGNVQEITGEMVSCEQRLLPQLYNFGVCISVKNDVEASQHGRSTQWLPVPHPTPHPPAVLPH